MNSTWVEFYSMCVAGFVFGFAGSFIWCPLCWVRRRRQRSTSASREPR